MSETNEPNEKKRKRNAEREEQYLWMLFKIALNIMDPFKIIRNYFLKPVFAMGMFTYEKLREKTEEQWTNTQNLAIKIFGGLVFCIVIICAAIMMYAVFYFSYMPAMTYVRPLHMQYKRICEDGLGSYEICQKRQIDDKTNAYHSYPTSHLELPKKHALMAGQPYIISVSMEVPDSPKNHEIGMFMVCAELKAQTQLGKMGKLNAHTCRSTMLQYYSPLMHKMKSIIYFPFIITGLYQQKQYLNLEMFPNYVDDATNPVTDIYIEIQSKIIEFYSVTLEITAHFTGLRYIMYNYPILSATFGICGNLMFILLLLTLVWYHWEEEMEWIEEARKTYVSKKDLETSLEINNQKDLKNDLQNDNGDSSSITTEKSNLDDENLSILDYNESDESHTADDDFLMDKEDTDKEIDLLPAHQNETKKSEE